MCGVGGTTFENTVGPKNTAARSSQEQAPLLYHDTRCRPQEHTGHFIVPADTKFALGRGLFLKTAHRSWHIGTCALGYIIEDAILFL